MSHMTLACPYSAQCLWVSLLIWGVADQELPRRVSNGLKELRSMGGYVEAQPIQWLLHGSYPAEELDALWMSSQENILHRTLSPNE